MTEMRMEEQITFADLGFVFGKTSLDACPPTEEKTSKPSSRNLSKSQTRKLPMCLCLKKADGPNQDGSMMRWEDGAWPGVSTMLSSGECRSAEDGFVYLPISTGFQHRKYYLTINCSERPREPKQTKLSEILEESADERYSLSSRACQGILTRAEKKGKELPDALKVALERQCSCSER